MMTIMTYSSYHRLAQATFTVRGSAFFLASAILLLILTVIFPLSAQVTPEVRALAEQADAADKAKNYDAAIAAYSQIIQANPQLSIAYYKRARDYERKGEYANAIADYKQAIALKPDLFEAYNNLAWILATCPDATCRDGKKAVELATRACELTQWRKAPELDSLAAACAEAGDFDAAIKWQKQMISSPGLNPVAVVNGQKHLALYEAHTPLHLAVTAPSGT